MLCKRKINFQFLVAVILLLWIGIVSGQDNTLTVGDGSGPPGSVNNSVSISLANQDTIAGLIFTLNYDPSVLTPSRVTTVDRTQNQSGLGYNIFTPGELLITLFDFDGTNILPSSGEILQIMFDVESTSPQGPSLLSMTDAMLSSTSYDSLSHMVQDGSLTITGTQALAPPVNLRAQVPGDYVILSWETPVITKMLKAVKRTASYYNPPLRKTPEKEPSAQLQKNSIQFITETTIDEIEPNNTFDQAQILTGDSLISVNGSAEISDAGDIWLGGDDIEDLFLITIIEDGLHVTLSDFTSDCDLYLFDAWDPEDIDYEDGSFNIGATIPENLVLDSLWAGTYLIGVSIYDPEPLGPDSTSYLLMLEGKFGGSEGIDVKSYNIYRSTSSNAVNTGVLLYNVDASTNSIQDQPPIQQTYYYQVTAVYDQGESTPSNEVSVSFTSSVEQNKESSPESFMLFQNYPNPFNPETTIQYSLPVLSYVNLTIVNISGKKVTTLKNELVKPGHHSVVWNGKDDKGRPVAGGIYLCRMQAGEYRMTIRLLLLK